MLPVHVSTIFGHGGGLAIKQEDSDEDEELTECLTAWKLRRILQLISLMTSFSGTAIFRKIGFENYFFIIFRPKRTSSSRIYETDAIIFASQRQSSK